LAVLAVEREAGAERGAESTGHVVLRGTDRGLDSRAVDHCEHRPRQHRLVGRVLRTDERLGQSPDGLLLGGDLGGVDVAERSEVQVEQLVHHGLDDLRGCLLGRRT